MVAFGLHTPDGTEPGTLFPNQKSKRGGQAALPGHVTSGRLISLEDWLIGLARQMA